MTPPPLLHGLPPRLGQWASQLSMAAGRYRLDMFLLAAIMDRESYGGLLLKPPGPGGTGDFAPRRGAMPPDGKGWGRGLMQIDFASWMDWLANNDWTDPLTNISKGAEILRSYIDQLGAEDAGICAYNAGPMRARRALERLPKDADRWARLDALDAMTARPSRNYASDVLSRRDKFKREAQKG